MTLKKNMYKILCGVIVLAATSGVLLVAGVVKAQFVRRVTVYPTAGVTVTSPGIINCGSDCYEDLDDTAVVTLTAAVESGKVFVKWIPEICNGGSTSTTCTFSLSSGDVSIQPSWSYQSYTVNVKKEGDGSGTVTGAGNYSYGNTVTLTATADSGSKFEGWQPSGNACVGSKGGGVNTSSTCSLQISAGVQTYTAVAKFTKTTTSSTPPKTNSSPPPQTPPTTTTATPLPLTEFKINDSEVAENAVIKENMITLSGKTTPLATVNLYIHSDPRLVTVKADDKGFWLATVTDLEDGSHTVEAEVIDPTSGQASERKQVAAFAVEAETAAPQITADKKTRSNLWWIIAVALVLLGGAAAGGWWFWKKRRSAQPPVNPDAPQPPAAPVVGKF